MTPDFRTATPADADAAVPLIYSSGPDAFNFVFDQPGRADALTFLRRAFLDGAGEFGYRNHVVAVEDGVVVGVGAAWGPDRNLAFTLSAARQILACYGAAGGLSVIARGLRTESIIRPPARDRLYIAHLGVAATHQGRGTGSALISYLIGHRSSASKLASLDVAFSNPRGQALYERLGFRVARERPSSLRNGRGHVPGMRYMEREL